MHCGGTDAVFLELPQPWLAIPSVGLMLKKDGVLCSFSPCIEQVQRACEAMKTCFTGMVHSFTLLHLDRIDNVSYFRKTCFSLTAVLFHEHK